MGRTGNTVEQMEINKARVGFTGQRRKMGVEDEVVSDFRRPEFAQIAKHKGVDGGLDQQKLGIGRQCSD
jgi:hypothetical protein